MRRVLAHCVLFVAFGVLAEACSLFVNFDPDGQACDARGGCLDGYGCVAGVCRKGADAGSSVCGVCAVGEKCLETSRACVPNTCQYTRCPVGSACDGGAGEAPVCTPTPRPNLGSSCAEDVDCGAFGPNRYCLRGAIPAQSASFSSRTGICVESCAGPGASCVTVGATCKSFPLAIDAGVTNLCIPDGVLVGCRQDFDCLESNYVCTVFDNPKLAPVTVCDVALPTGTGAYLPCSKSRDDGGTAPYCANGLCVASSADPAATSSCALTCSDVSCAQTQVCAPVEFTVREVPRFVPMCIPARTFCHACGNGDAGACGPDAPHCSDIPLGAPSCLAACSVDAGQANACPDGLVCTALPSGPRCLPPGGLCR